MKTTLRVVGVLALLFVICINTNAQGKIKAASGKRIRLGALYKIDVKGRYDKGIQKAVQDRKMEGRVDVEYFEYLNENEGLKKLIEIIEGRKANIILGPTDSGIFLRALQQREDLKRYKIPVISPLITAPVDNREEGWFFRTNVDVHRRVETIYDFIHKYWIRSIAVLYADTEFGRLAELNFKKELRGNQKKNYQAFQFKTSINARPALRQILNGRPEAVGIFGSNEDIILIYNLLRSMNYRGSLYKPTFFTIIDARQTAVDDFYFVSLVKSHATDTGKGAGTTESSDEIEGLAYDTTISVLSEIEKMTDNLFSSQRFRDQFASLLKGPVQIAGSQTGMAFDKYKNVAQPEVFHIQSGQVLKIELDQIVGWAEKIEIKMKLLVRRFGIWPVINFALLIFIVMMVSTLDLKRWYEGSYRKLFRPSPFWLLIGINVMLASILYIFLAETGRIRYDSVITVLIIAFTPSALLRTTLFETPTGKSIGLANLYDRFLLWVNDKLMMAKYLSQNSNINVIAYYNSLADMKSELNLIYQNARSTAQRIRLQSELEEEFEQADTYLERRRICARHLLRRLDWEELKGKRLVPKAFSDENPTDPRTIVRESVRYCSEDLGRQAKVKRLIKQYLDEVKNYNPKSYQEIKKEFHEELQDVRSERGELFVQIRFLLVRLGLETKTLIDEDLLPDKFEILSADTRSLWQKKWNSFMHKSGSE